MNLRQIQKEFKRIIKSPAHIEKECIELPIEESKKFTVSQRLRVYKNAYYIRISESLAEDFPKFFKKSKLKLMPITEDFLRKFPSNSYYMSNISRYFPEYIRESFPQSQELADLARYEWYECLAAYGRTDENLFDFSVLTKKTEEELLNTRFLVYNYVNILKSNFDLKRNLKPKISHFLFAKSTPEAPGVVHEIDSDEFHIIELIKDGKKISEILDSQDLLSSKTFSPEKIFVIFQKLVTLKVIRGVL